jgi:FkbM family methyltransferase
MFYTTANLFLSLIKKLGVSCACDIGSLDGTQALRFSNALPEARVFAFEANPYNFAAMKADPLLSRPNIALVQCAVSSKKGTADFCVVETDYNCPTANRGLSSLLIPSDSLKEIVRVPSVRIDEFLMERPEISGKIGLWIDVEGAAYDVLAGMEGIFQRVAIIHVEVEKKAMFQGQKLAADVDSLLSKRGFKPVTSEFWLNDTQGNVLYVNSQPAGPLPGELAVCKMRASAATLIDNCIRSLRYTLRGAGTTRFYQTLKRFYHRRIV